MSSAGKDIIRLECLKALLFSFIRDEHTVDSLCYCDSPKKYKNCHGKDFIKRCKTIN